MLRPGTYVFTILGQRGELWIDGYRAELEAADPGGSSWETTAKLDSGRHLLDAEATVRAITGSAGVRWRVAEQPRPVPIRAELLTVTEEIAALEGGQTMGLPASSFEVARPLEPGGPASPILSR